MTHPIPPAPPAARPPDAPRPTPRLRTAVGVCLGALGLAPARPALPVTATRPWRVSRPVPGIGLVSALLQGDPQGSRVILVHGCPGSALGWRDYLQDVPRGAEYVAPDRPGFGASAPRSAWPRLAEQAAAVAAWLPPDSRPTVLVGHSLGAAVVARVAADHPDRVAGLVCVAGALDPDLESIHPLQRLGDWPPVRALLPRVLRHANTELLALEGELRRLQADLPRIRARLALVHGLRDRQVPPSNVDYLLAQARGVRETRTWLLPERDHFLPWNAMADVRSAIDWARGGTCSPN